MEPRKTASADRIAALEAAVETRTHDLETALQQRTLLIHELDHRVKNNLQLISSLMQMQARRAEDPAVRAALEGMLGRVRAIATVHRRLFENADAGRFDVSEFVRDLVLDLDGATPDRIAFACELEPAEAPVRIAGPVALLIGELIANAARHGFPDGRSGEVRVAVAPIEEGLRIEIADDGVGMGPASSGAGFGLDIVEMLGRQLNARIRRGDGPAGVRTEIVLPLAERG